MIIENCAVLQSTQVGNNIYVLSFDAPAIARVAKAGQFVNIKPDDSFDPLLRRPFSIYRIGGNAVQVIFNIVGKGTHLLAHKKAGDMVNVLGPLGHPYGIDDSFQTALLLAGGLGVAPMPILTVALQHAGKEIHTFLGARMREMLAPAFLHNLHISTDDGSQGFRGTTVQCVEDFFSKNKIASPKIFACGPNPMLAAVMAFAEKHSIPCEVSLECAMACGIGICQGCPVEMEQGARKFNLVCTDGPVFDSHNIRIESLISNSH